MKITNIVKPVLPAKCIYINALRTPGTPVVIGLRLPGESYFRGGEGEILENSERGKHTHYEITRDESIRADVGWKNFENLEEMVMRAGWAVGAMDIVRFSHPPIPDPENWREHPGNGIGVDWCGIDSVYKIPGSTGIPADNRDLADVAAREGYWHWGFKPSAGWPTDSYIGKLSRQQCKHLDPDLSRSAPFPGFHAGKAKYGRSGEWWLGLFQSGEVEDRPGHMLRACYSFNTLTPVFP
jgi:hypothetical protein